MASAVIARSTSASVEAKHLMVSFEAARVVRDVSLSLRSGEVLGLVGESGSGKTTVCRAIAGILPATARVGGDVAIGGSSSPMVRRPGVRRNSKIGYVFQSPDAALNPCVRIGTQLTEHVQAEGVSAAESRARATEMLRRMRLDEPDRVMSRYPHEISGGQQQRVCIAMALLSNPDVLILDEPTTALDVTTQAAILDLLREMLSGSSIPTLHVSHDLRVVKELATRVAVMSRGEIVEMGPARHILEDPVHPYTRALIASQPDLRSRSFVAPRTDHEAPSPENDPGCRYAHRCALVEDACRAASISLETTGTTDHLARCRRAAETSVIPLRLPSNSVSRGERLRVSGLSHLTASGLSVALGNGRSRQTILFDVDLELEQGRTVAVVGESGAGKTTLARAIVGLAPPHAGVLRLDKEHLAPSVDRRSSTQLARLQMVFQSSTASLNPQRDVRTILCRAAMRLGRVPQHRADERVIQLLREVQLSETYLGRRPGELSGGERQRVAIARALAANPEFMILDEPVSSLDVSVQAAILALLQRIQSLERMGYLFISHDLGVVGAFAHDVVVLYGGRVVERGPVADVIDGVHHPYTEVLFRSIPGGIPLSASALRHLETPLNRQVGGCVFANRCPWRIGAVCDEVNPPYRAVGGGHDVRCHHDNATLSRIIGSDREAAAPLAHSTGMGEAVT
jgi:peptide/nickel transport system ATP-binding protein